MVETPVSGEGQIEVPLDLTANRVVVEAVRVGERHDPFAEDVLKFVCASSDFVF
jgi:hypothetical protein